MLGQDRPYVTGPARSPATVAVRADHLALRDLVEDALPVPIGKGVPDIKGLLAEVVEVEDDGVVFSAVDARMVLEELDQVGARRSPLTAWLPNTFRTASRTLVPTSDRTYVRALPGRKLDVDCESSGSGAVW